MNSTKKIICVGELLWDALPQGLFLGGAPFNVACHLQALGEDVTFSTRIGDDELGRQARQRVVNKGMSTSCMQVDREHPTGIVNVTLDRKDNPRYEIVEGVAWDYIEMDNGLEQALKTAGVLIFGSLAQRHPVSRNTIEKLSGEMVLNVFDINLRPPFDNRDIVATSLESAHIVKLNDEELDRLTVWFGLSGDMEMRMADLSDRFSCQSVCVTRGSRGAVLLHNGQFSAHEGYPVSIKDTIGAGDAFLAALISGLLAEKDGTQTLQFANAVGAYLATQNGATASLDMKQIQMLQQQGR